MKAKPLRQAEVTIYTLLLINILTLDIITNLTYKLRRLYRHYYE